MVDYSKFDHIGSSDESDAAHPVSIQQTCDAMFDSIRRVGPGQPKGFYYPLQGGDMVPFDVRDEICQDFGYQHGDVVVTDHGHISTVIGVFDEQLWFHAEGNDGADLWTNEVLKKVGRTAVEERAKGPPSLKSDWLRLDFAYAAGLENPTLAYFDTRKHLCETVGGFKHGDVIRVGAISAVTIGVKRDGHRLFLWFHPPHSPGDFLIHGG
ncbi:unnamed protein product [Durusdinium trenchii]|uniref:Uncharacterized protein n=1 Tax=Durusdinium trenchii TaxID=1381693 RepID=A0ABP0NF23_9DINO